jgi:penicillin-binding protein 1A
LRIRQRKEAPPKRRRIRKLRLLALLLVLLTLAVVAFGGGIVVALSEELGQLDPTARRTGDVDGVILGVRGKGTQNLAVIRGDESRVIVGSDEISPIMKQAIVAVEDKRFYEHDGVDVQGIARALWQDIRRREVVEGGSTITQQFVKNAYVRNERTLARKLREAAFAWQLERKWSKDSILTAYLNTIYFGNGAYGIQQAAQTYFQVGARRLDLAQAALLAGIPADPGLYDPAQRPAAAKARRQFVLQKLLEQGKITPAQLEAAHRTPLPRPENIGLPGKQGPAPYFANYVVDQLVARYGAERVFGGGLEVTTTIDLDLQELARKAIDTVLPGPDGPAAALVAIEPGTGAVRVMYGGANFRKSQFNLAAQAERQPGSSFKPLVLAAALRQGISPVTRFDSKPVEIVAGDRIWRVTNYEGSYLGRVDLATAMVRSDNAVYAQLTKLVGPRKIVETAHALGVGSELPAYFSIGLGAVAVNPLDMARAYATLANDGARVDGSLTGDRPRVIESIRFRRSGKTTMNAPVERAALPPERARLLTSILEEVVDKGTGERADLEGAAVAGKTGTTDNYADAWFVGYTPSLVTAVWVGYPDQLRPMLTEFDGEPVSGSTLPALIWKEFMTLVQKRSGEDWESFEPAPSLASTERRVVSRGGLKLDNGYCPETLTVAYFLGSGPSRAATCYADEVVVPRVAGLSRSVAEEVLADARLSTLVVLVPAQTGGRAGVVVKQEPKPGGHVSSGTTVRLVVSKARYGLVPNLVGSSLEDAKAQIATQDLRLRLRYADGPPGTVLRQRPDAGVAAAPELPITLVVGRATPTTSPTP